MKPFSFQPASYASPSTSRANGTASSRGGHQPASSRGGSVNSRRAALANAYAGLAAQLSSKEVKTLGAYSLGRVIGEGSFGKVRLGVHRLTNTRVAIKQIPKSLPTSSDPSSPLSLLTREIHHHRRLRHPHLLALYEIHATESSIYLISELCSGGELFDYLLERGRLPLPEARRVFGQLCLGVAHLHAEGVVHRDLKLENVLLDGWCNVKIADLGFGRDYEKGRWLETWVGTMGYVAPEVVAGKRYLGEEVDIWSLGVIFYALLTGSLPFDSDDEDEMRTSILACSYDLPAWLAEDARDLVSRILTLDPLARPSIRQILGHPFFTRPQSHHPFSHSSSQLLHSSSSFLAAAAAVGHAPPSPLMESDDGGRGRIVGSPVAMQAENATDEPQRPGTASSSSSSPTRERGSFLDAATQQQRERNGSLSAPPLERNVSSSSSLISLSAGALPVGAHSRTPSRTKRRSVGSVLSLSERALPPQEKEEELIDYLAILGQPRAAPLSTPEEQKLLAQLEGLGFDVGQMKHSVLSDACDSAAGVWYQLLAKAREKLELELAEKGSGSAKPSSLRREPREASRARGVGTVREEEEEPLPAPEEVTPVLGRDSPSSEEESDEEWAQVMTPSRARAEKGKEKEKEVQKEASRSAPLLAHYPDAGGAGQSRRGSREDEEDPLSRSTGRLPDPKHHSQGSYERPRGDQGRERERSNSSGGGKMAGTFANLLGLDSPSPASGATGAVSGGRPALATSVTTPAPTSTGDKDKKSRTGRSASVSMLARATSALSIPSSSTANGAAGSSPSPALGADTGLTPAQATGMMVGAAGAVPSAAAAGATKAPNAGGGLGIPLAGLFQRKVSVSGPSSSSTSSAAGTSTGRTGTSPPPAARPLSPMSKAQDGAALPALPDSPSSRGASTSSGRPTDSGLGLSLDLPPGTAAAAAADASVPASVAIGALSAQQQQHSVAAASAPKSAGTSPSKTSSLLERSAPNTPSKKVKVNLFSNFKLWLRDDRRKLKGVSTGGVGGSSSKSGVRPGAPVRTSSVGSRHSRRNSMDLHFVSSPLKRPPLGSRRSSAGSVALSRRSSINSVHRVDSKGNTVRGRRHSTSSRASTSDIEPPSSARSMVGGGSEMTPKQSQSRRGHDRRTSMSSTGSRSHSASAVVGSPNLAHHRRSANGTVVRRLHSTTHPRHAHGGREHSTSSALSIRSSVSSSDSLSQFGDREENEATDEAIMEEDETGGEMQPEVSDPARVAASRALALNKLSGSRGVEQDDDASSVKSARREGPATIFTAHKTRHVFGTPLQPVHHHSSSSLSQQVQPSQHRPTSSLSKPPPRDVFSNNAGKEDGDWVDEDDDELGGYAGGIGQASTRHSASGGHRSTGSVASQASFYSAMSTHPGSGETSPTRGDEQGNGLSMFEGRYAGIKGFNAANSSGAGAGPAGGRGQGQRAAFRGAVVIEEEEEEE